jgi:hypothetical protein
MKYRTIWTFIWSQSSSKALERNRKLDDLIQYKCHIRGAKVRSYVKLFSREHDRIMKISQFGDIYIFYQCIRAVCISVH